MTTPRELGEARKERIVKGIGKKEKTFNELRKISGLKSEAQLRRVLKALVCEGRIERFELNEVRGVHQRGQVTRYGYRVRKV